MFAKYKIKIPDTNISATTTTINIPLRMDFQIVDNAELIDEVFVSVETEKAINPIIDYEKIRILPVDLNLKQLDKVIYSLNISGAVTYGDLGFTDDDIRFSKESFKKSFLNLKFYDTDNPMTQVLVNNITLYSEIRQSDLLPDTATQISSFGYIIGIPGQPKPANMIPISFVLESPIYNPRGFAEGYYIYDYKDTITIDAPKYLYMRATFNNAKNGRSINMMVKDSPQPIDTLIHELYTKYELFRTDSGYYYKIDDTYQGNPYQGNTLPSQNNVIYTNNTNKNTVTVNLYQISAL